MAVSGAWHLVGLHYVMCGRVESVWVTCLHVFCEQCAECLHAYYGISSFLCCIQCCFLCAVAIYVVWGARGPGLQRIE